MTNETPAFATATGSRTINSGYLLRRKTGFTRLATVVAVAIGMWAGSESPTAPSIWHRRFSACRGLPRRRGVSKSARAFGSEKPPRLRPLRWAVESRLSERVRVREFLDQRAVPVVVRPEGGHDPGCGRGKPTGPSKGSKLV